MADYLAIYTIYDHPTDYPDYYVCRKHLIEGKPEGGYTVNPESELYLKSKSIENIRFTLENEKLFCLGREPDDDPVILESWI